MGSAGGQGGEGGSGWGARRDEAAAKPKKGQHYRKDSARGAYGAGHDCIETPAQFGVRHDEALSSARQNRNPLQPQITNDRAQERNAAAARFQERQPERRFHDLQGQAGDAGPGSEVQNPKPPRRKPLKEEERIEEEFFGDVFGPLVSREWVRPIPLEKKGQIPAEDLDLGSGWGAIKNLNKPARETLPEVYPQVLVFKEVFS